MSQAKALPMFHPELRRAPGSPSGQRVYIRPFPPPSESDGGLEIPGIAQERPFAGTLLAMGLSAHDKAYDECAELGDEVWWGKFAGILEEWHHIVKDGSDPKCKHGDWSYLKTPGDRMQLRGCGLCGAHKLAEPIAVANYDDIITNVTRQVRLESGEIHLVRGQTADGKTNHRYMRKDATLTTTEKSK